MLEFRTVGGQISRSDGQPWVGVRLIFTLLSGTFTPTDQIPKNIVNATTDRQGRFSVELWCNDEGELPSRYACDLPSKERFEFVLPRSVPSPVEISILRALGVTQQQPQYQTVVDFLQDYLSSVGVGTADQVALNPALSGLPGTVQGAIAAQQQQITALQANPPPPLRTLPDVNVGQTGGLLAYEAAGQEFNLITVIDGGNF